MRKSEQYRIIPELKIILEYFCGKTGLIDLVEHRKILIQDNDYDSNFNSITDFRDTDFVASRKDVAAYVEFTKSTPKMIGKRRAAILADTPQQTVIPAIYILKTQDLPFQIEIFSTLAAAINWVNLSDDDLETLEDILKEMRNNAICK